MKIRFNAIAGTFLSLLLVVQPVFSVDVLRPQSIVHFVASTQTVFEHEAIVQSSIYSHLPILGNPILAPFKQWRTVAVAAGLSIGVGYEISNHLSSLTFYTGRHWVEVLSATAFVIFNSVRLRRHPFDPSAVVSTTNLKPSEELRVLRYVLGEAKKEQRQPGRGSLRSVVVITDQHGSINKFDDFILDSIKQVFPGRIPGDAQLTHNRGLTDQLNFYGISPDELKSRIYFHNLGDLMDRGPHGIAVFRRSRELIEMGISDITLGNHCFWAFENLQGFHLPWYEGYKFHAYGDRYDEEFGTVDEILKKAHSSMPKTRTKRWWAQELKTFTDYQKEQQKTHWKALDDRVNGPHGLYKRVEFMLSGMPKSRYDVMWEQFHGYNSKHTTSVSTGVHAVGEMSVVWWQKLLTEFEEAHAELIGDYKMVPNGPADQAWLAAIDMMKKEIIPVLSRDLEKHVRGGDWQWRIFEAINSQNYTSPEWWAKDWIFHKGWGESILLERNSEIGHHGDSLDEGNYIDDPVLNEMAQFYRQNFSLYLRDIYQQDYLHAFLPVDKATGEFYFTYKGQIYRGKGNEAIPSFREGLARIAEDVQNPATQMKDLQEAYELVNFWYADNTTTAKEMEVAEVLNRFGPDILAEKNGISGVLHTGHLPVFGFKEKVGAKLGVIKGFLVGHFAFDDHGMGEKFSGRGGYVIISPDGLYFHGIRYEQSPHWIERNAPTSKRDAKKNEGPFQWGDFDIEQFRSALKQGRAVDRYLLEKAGLSPGKLPHAHEEELLAMLNDALEDPALILHLDGLHLNISPAIHTQLGTMKFELSQGIAPMRQTIPQLNKPLLLAIYPYEDQEILFENTGIDRAEFLPDWIRNMENRIAELTPPRRTAASILGLEYAGIAHRWESLYFIPFLNIFAPYIGARLYPEAASRIGRSNKTLGLSLLSSAVLIGGLASYGILGSALPAVLAVLFWALMSGYVFNRAHLDKTLEQSRPLDTTQVPLSKLRTILTLKGSMWAGSVIGVPLLLDAIVNDALTIAGAQADMLIVVPCKALAMAVGLSIGLILRSFLHQSNEARAVASLVKKNSLLTLDAPAFSFIKRILPLGSSLLDDQKYLLELRRFAGANQFYSEAFPAPTVPHLEIIKSGKGRFLSIQTQHAPSVHSRERIIVFSGNIVLGAVDYALLDYSIWLEMLLVTESLRRMGLGQYLMNELITLVRKHNLEAVEFQSNDQYEDIVSYYRHLAERMGLQLSVNRHDMRSPDDDDADDEGVTGYYFKLVVRAA